MPTDLAVLFVRKSEAQAQARDNATLMVVWFGVCLLIIEALFASHVFAEATALLGGS
jgi:hypothetical protein